MLLHNQPRQLSISSLHSKVPPLLASASVELAVTAESRPGSIFLAANCHSQAAPTLASVAFACFAVELIAPVPELLRQEAVKENTTPSERCSHSLNPTASQPSAQWMVADSARDAVRHLDGQCFSTVRLIGSMMLRRTPVLSQQHVFLRKSSG